jgi:hypothetical protein
MWNEAQLRQDVEGLFDLLSGVPLLRGLHLTRIQRTDRERDARNARLASARPVSGACPVCGGDVPVRYGGAGRQPVYCSRPCQWRAFKLRNNGRKAKERTDMAKEKIAGQEYEPAWVECSACGARRPPEALKDGKCAGWVYTEPSRWVGQLSRWDRCSELAATRGRVP